MIDILVIDDEQMLRDLLLRILRREGYAVATAGNGREGLEVFAATPARLVVIDMNMPEMGGAGTISELRRTGRGFSILAMSGVPWRSPDAPKAIGADAGITKPFLPSAFLGVVKAMLEDVP